MTEQVTPATHDDYCQRTIRRREAIARRKKAPDAAEPGVEE